MPEGQDKMGIVVVDGHRWVSFFLSLPVGDSLSRAIEETTRNNCFIKKKQDFLDAWL